MLPLKTGAANAKRLQNWIPPIPQRPTLIKTYRWTRTEEGNVRKSTCMTIALLLVAAFTERSIAASQYIRRDPSNTKVVVFIHGVLGDSASTWKNKDSGAYWPNLLMVDKLFDKINIFTFDFPSPMATTSFSLDELADNMRLIFDSYGISDHRDIVIVAHSMGGLVTRAYLAKYRQIIPKMSFIYFLATPTTGSYLASIAKIGSFNSQFAKMTPMSSDSYLADLQRTWLASPELAAIPSYCAYELLFVAGVKVVDQQSATNLCNKRLDPMNFNHIDIAKPYDADAIQYLALKSAYISSKSTGLTNLRADIQNVGQIVEIIGPQLKLADQPLYCDAIRGTLLLAHSGQSGMPIRILSIAAKTDIATDVTIPSGACATDPLTRRPYGVVETDTFGLTIDDNGIRAKYIKNANEAYQINSDNLLGTSGGARGRNVQLKAGDAPDAFDFQVHSTSRLPQRVWFSIVFDEGGERLAVTRPMLIWR